MQSCFTHSLYFLPLGRSSGDLPPLAAHVTEVTEHKDSRLLCYKTLLYYHQFSPAQDVRGNELIQILYI